MFAWFKKHSVPSQSRFECRDKKILRTHSDWRLKKLKLAQTHACFFICSNIFLHFYITCTAVAYSEFIKTTKSACFWRQNFVKPLKQVHLFIQNGKQRFLLWKELLEKDLEKYYHLKITAISIKCVDLIWKMFLVLPVLICYLLNSSETKHAATNCLYSQNLVKLSCIFVQVCNLERQNW